VSTVASYLANITPLHVPKKMVLIGIARPSSCFSHNTGNYLHGFTKLISQMSGTPKSQPVVRHILTFRKLHE